MFPFLYSKFQINPQARTPLVQGLPDRVATLRDFARPTTPRGLPRLLAMLCRGYNRMTFCCTAPGFSACSFRSTRQPSHHLDTALQQAYSACKDHLAEATLLNHNAANAQLGVFTEASGACFPQLCQRHMDYKLF